MEERFHRLADNAQSEQPGGGQATQAKGRLGGQR